MPIVYNVDMPTNKTVSLDGFEPAETPFTRQPSGEMTPSYDRELHKQAVDVIADFTDSNNICIAKTFKAATQNEANAEARTAYYALSRVLADGVGVFRRGDTVYLIKD